jgi:hypothetical protein
MELANAQELYARFWYEAAAAHTISLSFDPERRIREVSEMDGEEIRFT